MWGWFGGCFLITADEVADHDRRIPREPPPEDTGPELVWVSLVGTDLDDWRGWAVNAVLTEDGVVLGVGESTVRKGDFEIVFDALEPGGSARIDVLVDGDGDGVCTYGTNVTGGTDVALRVRNVDLDVPGPLEIVLDPVEHLDSRACDTFEGGGLSR
jgi:hypothetical protein